MTFFLSLFRIDEKKRVKKIQHIFTAFIILHSWKNYSKSAIIIVQVRLVMPKVVSSKYYKTKFNLGLNSA